MGLVIPMNGRSPSLAKVSHSTLEELASSPVQYVVILNRGLMHVILCTQGMKEMRADMGKISGEMPNSEAQKLHNRWCRRRGRCYRGDCSTQTTVSFDATCPIGPG